VKIIDRRNTSEEMSRQLVVAYDSFMSWWGEAEHGRSACAWSCEDHHLASVARWVESRDEMSDVRVVDSEYVPDESITAHFSIYVVKDSHPALAES
jgi:hypothetical protein